MNIVREIKNYIVQILYFLYREISVFQVMSVWLSSSILEVSHLGYKNPSLKYSFSFAILPLVMTLIFTFLLKQAIYKVNWKLALPWIMIMFFNIYLHFRSLQMVKEEMEKDGRNSFLFVFFSVVFGDLITKVFKVWKVIKLSKRLYHYRHMRPR